MDEPNPSINGWYLIQWKSRELMLKLNGGYDYKVSKALWQMVEFRSDMAYFHYVSETFSANGSDVLDAIRASLHLPVEDFDTEDVFKIGETIHLEDWAKEIYGELFQEWQ